MADEQIDRGVPETLRLRMIAPSMTVSDVAASLEWYHGVVGFTIKQLWEEEGKVLGAALVAGAATLMTGQDDWAKGRDPGKGAGTRLLSSTSQSVDDVAAAIKERGGALESEPADMPWGGRAFSMVDPDGFNITFASE